MADVRQLLKHANAARNKEAIGDSNGKKRKATTVLHSPSGKKSKSTPPALQAPPLERETAEKPSEEVVVEQVTPAVIDERLDDEQHAAELAALDRELAMMAASMPVEASMQAGPAISAPPMSADEIFKAEQTAQRVSRDAEVAAEREDAARALDDEFDAMEGLEERARRLRARREALRHADSTLSLRQGFDGSRSSDGPSNIAATAGDQPPSSPRQAQPARDPSVHEGEGANDGDGDDDDDEDDDSLAGWNFGRS